MKISRCTIIYCFIVALIFVLEGCSDSNSTVENNQPTPQRSGLIQTLPDITGSTFFSTSNNSARLTGDIIGNGEEELSDLVKSVEVSFVTVSPDFLIGSATVSRSSSSSNQSFSIVPIKNVSGELKCNIKVNDISYLNLDDDLIIPTISGSGPRVTGSSYELIATGIEINSCLDSDETGYLLDLESGIYNDLITIQYGNIVSSNSKNISSNNKAIPTGYTVNESGDILTVTVENQGLNTITVLSGSKYILLDSDGVPLTWGFLGSSGAVLQPMETTIIEVQLSPLYRSATNILRPVIDYFDGVL